MLGFKKKPKTTQIGIKAVWGNPGYVKQIIGLPPNCKFKVKLRNKDFARVFAKTNTGITAWILRDDGDHWTAIYPQATNFYGVAPG